MGVFRDKPKRQRTRKSLQDKIDRLADKRALELFKKYPALLDQYIAKKLSITIPPEPEMKIKQLEESIRLRAYSEAASEIESDAEFMEVMRDNLIADLLGRPLYPPRARGKNGPPPVPNMHSQLQRFKQNVREIQEMRELLGGNSNDWTKVLDPNLIKLGLDLLKTIFGNSGSVPGANTAQNDNLIYAVEINGEYVKMNYQTFLQYRLQHPELNLPEVRQNMPAQAGPANKPPASIEDPVSPLPAAGPPTTNLETNSVHPGAGDPNCKYLTLIIAAVDKPAEDFAKNTLELSQAGDPQAIGMRDFLLANDYEDLVKKSSPFQEYSGQLEPIKEWYERVTANVRTRFASGKKVSLTEAMKAVKDREFFNKSSPSQQGPT